MTFQGSLKELHLPDVIQLVSVSGKSGVFVLSHEGEDGLMLNGDTGLSAGLKDELNAIIGQERTIPLYDSVGGTGNTTMYHIVGFAAIRIVDVKLTGQNKYVTIQPAVVVDGSAIGGGDDNDGYKIYTPVTLVK